MEDATGLKINVIAAPTDSDTRQQKITTILSTGDSSVDIIEINDEMSASFKNSGWLEGLNDTVMTEDIRGEFPQGYLEDMITDKDGNIIGVPGYSGYLAFWVNQEIMDEVGIASIDTKEDFVKYMEAVSGTADTATAVPGRRPMSSMRLPSLSTCSAVIISIGPTLPTKRRSSSCMTWCRTDRHPLTRSLTNTSR